MFFKRKKTNVELNVGAARNIAISARESITRKRFFEIMDGIRAAAEAGHFKLEINTKFYNNDVEIDGKIIKNPNVDFEMLESLLAIYAFNIEKNADGQVSFISWKKS